MTVLHGNQVTTYYDPESTPGTSRTGQTWKVLAHHSIVDISDESTPVTVKKSGSVDNTSNEKGVRLVRVRITCNPSEADGKFFLKTYGSTDTSLSMIFKNSGGTFLWRVTGCYVKTITPSCQKYPTPGACQFVVEIWGFAIVFTEPASTSYTSVPDGFVNWADTTVKIASVTQSLWWNWTFTITNDLDIQHDENGTVVAITRGDRDLDVSIDKALEDTASTQFNAAQVSFATVSIDILLNADTYTFGATAYSQVSVVADRTRLSGLQLKGKPSTLTIT